MTTPRRIPGEPPTNPGGAHRAPVRVTPPCLMTGCGATLLPRVGPCRRLRQWTVWAGEGGEAVRAHDEGGRCLKAAARGSRLLQLPVCRLCRTSLRASVASVGPRLRAEYPVRPSVQGDGSSLVGRSTIKAGGCGCGMAHREWRLAMLRVGWLRRVHAPGQATSRQPARG